MGCVRKANTKNAPDPEQIEREFEDITKKRSPLKLFKYDNFEGDKGIILAESYNKAAEIYSGVYGRQLSNSYKEYVNGGVLLTELGLVESNRIYTIEEM